ncbi:GtrA family protein [Rahnella bonaserana]|jgi:putative flippase GtrA|uniref:GtrA family protein n=1 Tax=Rahnella bonaserana TaxID=2816248 RepID=A0ABS6LQ18_9GAMM|nr:GtrA family protein [Rahnella bonaserana]
MIVGLLNTGVTALVIFFLMYAKFNLYAANAIGYVVGIIFSFVVNSVFTFNSKLSLGKLSKFVATCGIAYIINLIPLKLILFFFPEYTVFAQLVGMAFYTVTGFILNRFWVMK